MAATNTAAAEMRDARRTARDRVAARHDTGGRRYDMAHTRAKEETSAAHKAARGRQEKR